MFVSLQAVVMIRPTTPLELQPPAVRKATTQGERPKEAASTCGPVFNLALLASSPGTPGHMTGALACFGCNIYEMLANGPGTKLAEFRLFDKHFVKYESDWLWPVGRR